MFRSMLLAVFVGTLVPSSALSAQGVEAVLGKWEMTMETPRGSMTQVFEFDLNGDILEGIVESRMGSSELKNLAFEDGTLTFEVERSFGDRTMVQGFTAKIEDGVMTGTMSGGRRGDREFTATRVAT